MTTFPNDLKRFGISTRCFNMLLNCGMSSIEEVSEELKRQYPHGEAYFLRIPGAGRKSVNELKEAIDLWRRDQTRNDSTVLMFTECLDRFAEAERDMYHHSGTDTPAYDKAKERRDRLRKTLIETFERMLP